MKKSPKELENRINEEVGKIIVGKSSRIKLITAAILSQGHVLLDDLPGVGKTTLVKSLAKALGCDSKRIQFTPDMLPSDITGMNIYDRASGAFKRLKGPVMTNLLLADELNRAIPRTQSALLEAMEERQVTIDGVTEKLPEPFVVLATQNPVESESTFRLPAAQMDRFLMCLSLGYPTKEEEAEMLKVAGGELPFDSIETVTDPRELCETEAYIQENVKVSDSVMEYIVELAAATRNNKALKLGASPRATRALFRASKSLAAINGRDYVIPDDVHELARPVLCHRFVLSSKASIEGKTAFSVMDDILETVPVPPRTRELLNGEK